MDNSIKKLIEERSRLRAQKKYDEADEIREKLIDLGYIVEDSESLSALSEKTKKTPSSFLVLFGSGEISSTGRAIHEYVFKKIGRDQISIVIVTTPAGFQPNVKEVHEEIAEFFERSLSNFHPKISIVYANSKDEANTYDIIKPIEEADYIFTGPGSPTYAVDNLKDTRLLDVIKKRLREGATLCLSSAATVAFSHMCLPVYEIYKVGEKLHWRQGLNFYGKFWRDITVVPHFNNSEGGRKLDTSKCFMGRERFEKLLKLLPKGEKVLAIDEHTALIVDLLDKREEVVGKGGVQKVL